MCLAIPGKLVEITGNDPILREGKVDFSGVSRKVSLSCVPEAQVGDYVLIHVGMAISVIDEDEAQRVFRYLEEMGELDDEEVAGS
ncbi:MAG: HypC/HybG/HupF family hydrogenase formation chaperone [Acidobacteriota bacterium]|nr:MAG: HypC/HybG/HupF family hydrogenase formation chaperone [Acidobacteriota bacterium]